MKYRKRPVELEAWQVPKHEPSVDDLPPWLKQYRSKWFRMGVEAGLNIATTSGKQFAPAGWWVVWEHGRFTIMAPEIFTLDYEPIPQEQT